MSSSSSHPKSESGKNVEVRKLVGPNLKLLSTDRLHRCATSIGPWKNAGTCISMLFGIRELYIRTDFRCLWNLKSGLKPKFSIFRMTPNHVGPFRSFLLKITSTQYYGLDKLL